MEDVEAGLEALVAEVRRGGDRVDRGAAARVPEGSGGGSGGAAADREGVRGGAGGAPSAGLCRALLLVDHAEPAAWRSGFGVEARPGGDERSIDPAGTPTREPCDSLQ